MANIPGDGSDERDLFLIRIFDAPAEKVYEAWTNPVLIKQWFAPHPMALPVAELDVRPGGSSYMVMRGPDGNDMPLHGVYLEVIPNKRLVSTDAYKTAWEPSEKPFLTIDLTFEEFNGRTRYTARTRHWSMEDRVAHEEMGFHQGWNQCADQLADLVEKSN
ncbi:SRPBCC family protein [Oceaniferula spumae]|uniref:SRPBCC family protein n=1 Tax=Oceaniferula spumae TaxID=2979115 RepID=UPI003F4EC6A2